MTPTEIDQFLAAASIEPDMIERAAWDLVLADRDMGDVVAEAAELRTRKKWLNPDDFNPDAHPPGWAEAWTGVVRLWPVLGAAGDYGHPAVNDAVMAVRRELRYESEETARRAFRGVYASLTAGTTPEAHSGPRIGAGGRLPLIGRRVDQLGG